MLLAFEQDKVEGKQNTVTRMENRKTPKEPTANHWKAHQTNLEAAVKIERGFAQFNIG